MKNDIVRGVVGTPISRIEGPDKVTGRALYSGDVRPPGLLYARVLRSPLPHARIARIDIGRAEKMAGVHAVLCSANAPDIDWYEGSKLFDRRLSFEGDEVAAVAAESEEAAEDALRMIDVAYEALPFAFTLDDGNKGEPNVQGRGDIARGLREADIIIEATYTTQTAVHNALEPHGCTALWEGDTLVLYESTQGMFAIRDEVADKLGVAKAHVRVVTPHMGGGFGAKQVAWKHSVIAALLAKRARRPVQLVLDRRAENLAVGNRNATRQSVRIGAKRDGTLTAIDVQALIQAGAYTPGGEDSDVIGTYQTLYRCANVRAEQVIVRTNTGPAVAFRAPGYAEANFALESTMDELARELDVDPIALRLIHYADVDQQKNKPYTNVDSLKRCYERVGEAFGWQRRAAVPNGSRKRGVGFAAHDWAGGGGFSPADVRVEIAKDRTVRVITGTQDIGTGTRTALSQIVADEIGVPLDRVSIAVGDTRDELYAPSSAGSATLATLGPALRDAARQAKEKGVGAAKREKNRQDVAIRTCGAQCVEVEVDTETGDVRVLSVAAAHDCGLIVNPMLVESQLIGGITQGVGYALSEEQIIDPATGIVLNANLEDYKLQTIADVPDFIGAMESIPDWVANSTGAKGIGEPPLIPTAAAIANAIFDATGVRLHDLPVKREKLLK